MASISNGLIGGLNKVDVSGVYEVLFANCRQNAMILMDDQGFILQTNKAFEDHFGYTESDLAGKHTRVLFTVEDQRVKKPEIEISTVNEHGQAEDNNYVVHKDGSLVWVMGESILIKAGTGNFISKILSNIHTQKVMERFLVQSNELVESVLSTIKDGLVVVDADLRILKCNQAFYDLFSITEQSIEGILLFDLNYAFWNGLDMQTRLETLYYESGLLQPNEIEWKRDDGTNRTFRLTARPIDHDAHDNRRTLFVVNDITLEKELEQQKEDLIGFVTHELRNPLANMALCAELMADSIKENRVEEVEEYLEKTKSNIKRLTNVVRELHDATKAGSGQLKINKETVEYEQIVQDAIDTVTHLHPRYEIVKTGDAQVKVYADKYRLLQVLNNYLTNAIKYSPKADKILITLSVDDGKLVTAVTDYGYGIPSAKLPHIFNRYYRLESSHGTEGLGLGLYLAKEIITAHGGEVWVESEENKGSTFYFSLSIENPASNL